MGARWDESGEAAEAAGVCGALALPALSASRTGGAGHPDQVGGLPLHPAAASLRSLIGELGAAGQVCEALAQTFSTLGDGWGT